MINFRKDKSCDGQGNQNYDNLFILVTFPTFHFDISGNFDNDDQSAKIPLISISFLVFQLDISGNDFKLIHL